MLYVQGDSFELNVVDSLTDDTMLKSTSIVSITCPDNIYNLTPFQFSTGTGMAFQIECIIGRTDLSNIEFSKLVPLGPTDPLASISARLRLVRRRRQRIR